MTIGRCAPDLLPGNDAAGPGAVVDHHGLAQPFGDAAGDGASRQVRDAAGGEGYDHADRPALRPCALGARRTQDRQGKGGAEQGAAVQRAHAAAQSAAT